MIIDFFDGVLNTEAGLSRAKILCNEDWLQIFPDADGQRSTQVDTLTGKRWRLRGPLGLQKICETARTLAYFNYRTKYITICPNSWPRYGRPILGPLRTRNYTGVGLGKARVPFSYVLLHEMLHAGSAFYSTDGRPRLRGNYSFTRTCNFGLRHLQVI